MAASVPTSEFWHFSLRLYGRPGVPEICLRLQDEALADVNVMFYLLYLGQCGRRLEVGDVERIDTICSEWRQTVVHPLRSVRRQLKSPPPSYADDASKSLRTDVKRLELEAERLQQLALERNVPPAHVGESDSNRQACMASNLHCYLTRLANVPGALADLLVRAVHED